MEFMGEGIGETSLPHKPLDHLQMHLLAGEMDPAHFSLVTKQQGGTVGGLYDTGSHKLSLAAGKRKAPMEPLCDASVFQAQRLSMSVKKVTEMEFPQWLRPSHAAPIRKVSMANASGSSQHPQASSKKPPCKIIQKNQPGPVQPCSNQNESIELVRSKLKESLAAALALVSSQEAAEACGSSAELHEPQVSDLPVASQASQEECAAASTAAPIAAASSENLTYDWTDGDVSFSDNFFVRDELLQMHGLSWVMGPEPDVAMAAQTHGAMGQSQETPGSLASRIEAELFKLFGGVNKKYKEKGRSLLFNLKDNSNPELREKVMCGDIPPSRLCSMTAEELASRELSEWRMAKAEKLAQMVVLPDSGDLKRLVKKTHKGEFQVELDHTDSMQPEIGVVAGSTYWLEPKKKEPSMVHGHGHLVSEENMQHVNGSAKQREEDDEFKDTDFLPPIVSLDEFMDSIDTKKSKPLDARQVHPPSSSSSSSSSSTQVSLESKSTDLTGNFADKSATDRTDTVDVCVSHLDTNEKMSSSHVQSDKQLLPVVQATALWEGMLQLNVNGAASVTCVYKSGDRGSPAGWPSSIEIKGRVRLDAFDKFLQQLPKSKSRSLMVVHFVCKDGGGGGKLQEVAETYEADARVGFAEPAVGVEVYFCPSHPKTLGMLSGALPKGHSKALSAVDKGLIGVVVWRKSQTKPQLKSTLSPNSAPRKPNSKKQSSSKEQQKISDSIETAKPKPHGDDDDDVPPGFNTPASHDVDDDLPDFNFLGSAMRVPSSFGIVGQPMGSLQQPHSSPSMDSVEKMRELVHKYGQSKMGFGNGSSHVNDDDDEDDGMPEWQPEVGYAYQGLVAQPQLVSNAVLSHQPLPMMSNGSLLVPPNLMLPTQVTTMAADPRTMGSMWPPNGLFGCVQPIGLHAPAPFHQDMP